MTTLADKKLQVENIWQESFQTELNNSLKEELRQAALIGVKKSLEEGLNEELNEHLRKGKPEHRSGYYKRGVETGHGPIEDLKVPKLRRGNKEREWQILTRYQRCLQHVLDGLLYLYVLGLSMRDLQEGLQVMYGSMLSVNAINQITLKVQGEMEERQQRPIEGSPAIIIVDGVWGTILYCTGEKVLDRAGHLREKRQGEDRVILAALAVWPDGSYHILHYEVSLDEDQANWSTFWQHLIERGLDPQAVKLVVSDGTKGLLGAMAQHLPNAKQQRCTVHKVRGFERYLAYQDLPEVHPITDQPLTEDDAKSWRRFEIKKLF